MSWLAHRRRWSRRDKLAAVLVLVGLLVLILLAYGVIVVIGGAILGRGRADLGLSVVATAVIAVSFDRVRSLLQRLATRAVHGGRASPYEVLNGFAETVAGRYPTEELPGRMARLLAEGTGAEWVQVWLIVAGRAELAATWPLEKGDPAGPVTGDPHDHEAPGRHVRDVRHGDDLLGVLVLQEHAPLTSAEERLFLGLAAQAGLVLRGAGLRAELERQAVQLSARADELRLLRKRLVDAHDEQRRLLERDIHDGAQQHLVALAVNLRRAETLAQRSPEHAGELLAGQVTAAVDTVDTLVQLARGIYPPLLSEGGLVVALTAMAATSPVPVGIEARDLVRFPSRLEAAAYFCCLEAMQNAIKHAGARSITITLGGDGTSLELLVQDDGRGFDPGTEASGSGLRNLHDRIESVGGTLVIASSPEGTLVEASLPGAER